MVCNFCKKRIINELNCHIGIGESSGKFWHRKCSVKESGLNEKRTKVVKNYKNQRFESQVS